MNAPRFSLMIATANTIPIPGILSRGSTTKASESGPPRLLIWCSVLNGGLRNVPAVNLLGHDKCSSTMSAAQFSTDKLGPHRRRASAGGAPDLQSADVLELVSSSRE